MNPPRWPMVVYGLFLALIGLPLLLGGAVAVTAQLALRDADGYYTSPAYRLSTASDAVVLDNVHLDLDRTALRRDRWEATARIAAQGTDDRPIFVGIAARAEVDAYLTGVAPERIADVHRTGLDTRPVSGSVMAGRPADQSFWVASATGPARQEITWPVQDGRWAVVVMNADASPGVDATTSAADPRHRPIPTIHPIRAGLSRFARHRLTPNDSREVLSWSNGYWPSRTLSW